MLNFLLGRSAQTKAITTTAEEEVGSKLAAVLYLPRASESISYRPYLDKVGSATLLEWFLDTFTLANPTIPLSVLLHAEDETPKLREILLNHNVLAVPTPHKLQTHAFQQAAKQASKPHLAVFTIEMGLSPRDLLAKAFLHHLKHQNKFTFVTGFPLNCTPEIYNSDFLAMICGLRIPNLPQKPRAFIEHSLTASKDKTSLPGKRMSLGLASTLNSLISISLASIPFNASDVYGGNPCDLPEIVKMSSQFHVEVARDVVHSQSLSGQANGSLQPLHLWKNVSIQKQRATRMDLIRAINAPDSRISDYGNKRCNRVLYVSNPSAYSGAEESLCQFIGRIDPEQYESFALVGASGFFAERMQKLGTKVITRERDFSAPTIENFLFTLAVLKKVQPDVVHINGLSGTPIILAAKLLGVPIVYHLRTEPFESHEECLKNSDFIIAVSEFIKREASKKDIEKNQIRVIFDGVDSQHFSGKGFNKAAMRKEFGLPQNASIALNIARFTPYKRHDLLIAASEIVSRQVPDFHLVLVGEVEDVPYHRSIIDRISKSKLAERVTVVGFQRDIRKIEAAADALVLCSDGEPLGTCLIEAMAMGIGIRD